MKRKTILISLIILIIGFTTGFFSSLFLNKRTYKENELFAFMDTFTKEKIRMAPQMMFSYPEKHVLLVTYLIDDQNGGYAVYDYKNNILYKNIGDSNRDDKKGQHESYPLAFVGGDKLLMNTFDYRVKPGVSEITIQDFNNNLIKVIPSDGLGSDVDKKYGDEIRIYQSSDEGALDDIVLNTKTLETRREPHKWEN